MEFLTIGRWTLFVDLTLYRFGQDPPLNVALDFRRKTCSPLSTIKYIEPKLVLCIITDILFNTTAAYVQKTERRGVSFVFVPNSPEHTVENGPWSSLCGGDFLTKKVERFAHFQRLFGSGEFAEKKIVASGIITSCNCKKAVVKKDFGKYTFMLFKANKL